MKRPVPKGTGLSLFPSRAQGEVGLPSSAGPVGVGKDDFLAPERRKPSLAGEQGRAGANVQFPTG